MKPVEYAQQSSRDPVAEQHGEQNHDKCNIQQMQYQRRAVKRHKAAGRRWIQKIQHHRQERQRLIVAVDQRRREHFSKDRSHRRPAGMLDERRADIVLIIHIERAGRKRRPVRCQDDSQHRQQGRCWYDQRLPPTAVCSATGLGRLAHRGFSCHLSFTDSPAQNG